MLVIGRKSGEKVQIGNDVTVHVVKITGNAVRIGIEAPDGTNIRRTELPIRDEMDSHYDPKPGEIAGFELIGFRTANGIRLGSREVGTDVSEFPKSVHVYGMIYELETVKDNDVPADHPGHDVCWGVYC